MSLRSGSALLRALIYFGCLCIAGAYGISFTLPLYIQALGGNEAVAGNVLFAGAFGTLACVGASNQLMERLRPHVVIALGCLSYAAGALALGLSGAIHPGLYAGGLLLGAGWGLAFTIGPILLSSIVSDEKRAVYFSFLSAFNALGMGISPVAARHVLDMGVSHTALFLTAVALATASSAVFYAAGRGIGQITVPDRGAIVGGERAAARRILGSDAKFGLIMVFLGACVFSTMMNFQTTYARASGLDFAVFYVCYTAAVIGARFLLSGAVNRQEPQRMTVALLATMCVSLGLFTLVGQSAVLYGLASAMLGVSYGLVYPLIQAQSVNAVDQQVRSRTLVYFSLAYFLGVFGFPLVGGQIIVHGGYETLLAVLILIALGELAVALWRMAATGAITSSVRSR
jgi:MFS family permease